MRDLTAILQFVRGAAQTLAGVTPNASAAFDVRGFDAVNFYLSTGTVTDAGTAAGFTMKLQESDALVGAGFTDVAALDLIGANLKVTLDTADNVTAGVQGYVGNKRYVRSVFTGTTLTDAVVWVNAVMGKPHRAPTVTIGATAATT